MVTRRCSAAWPGSPTRWATTRRAGGGTAVHRAVFPHQGLDAVSLLRPLLSRSVPNAGDWSTVNVGPVDSRRRFEQTEVPGYRQIIDLSPANDSRFLDAVGQSGHFLSPHYDDFLRGLAAGARTRRCGWSGRTFDAGAIGTLTLSPSGK